MESILNYKDFRKFIRQIFTTRSKNGFGESTKLAQALGVNNTLISQILKGDKCFTLEQAVSAAAHLNLNELESEYFLLLIQLDRAGTKEYRLFVEKQIEKLRAKSQELVNRVKHNTKISEEKRATYYSDWIYSATRLSTLLPGLKNAEALAQHYNLPTAKIKKVVEFLLEAELLKLEKGELSLGVLSTHLDAQSPWIKSHHSNWRQKALQDISAGNSKSLHYSAPLTISKVDAEKIREILVKTINSVDEVLEPSESEELHCLTIDWFQVR
jgi:uncharacterized protein (TIGR02147 family)